MRKVEAEAAIKDFVTKNYSETPTFVRSLNRHITSLSHDVYKGHGLHGHSTRQEIRNRLWRFAMNEVMKVRKGSNTTEKEALWVLEDEVPRPAVRKTRPMNSDLLVSEIMTKHPVTISTDSYVAHAKWIFRTNRVGGLPVVSEGRLVGIITLVDARRVSRYRDRTTRIEDVMSKSPYCVHPDERVSAALQKMNEARIGRICVVSRSDSSKLVGLVSLTDIRRPRRITEVKCEYCGNVYDRRRERCPSCGAGRKVREIS